MESMSAHHVLVAKQWREPGLSRRWCTMWNWASSTSNSERAQLSVADLLANEMITSRNETKVRIFPLRKGSNKDSKEKLHFCMDLQTYLFMTKTTMPCQLLCDLLLFLQLSMTITLYYSFH